MVEKNESWMLVTGAASGIGEAVAVAAAHKGYRLVLLDRSAAGLHDLGEELSSITEVTEVVSDVTNLEALSDSLASTRASRGPLAAIAHCAGVEVMGTVDAMDPADWARCITVNLTGTFNVARVVIPELIESRGAMAIVASDAGVTGAQGYAAYCASKHGVVGLVRAMALDYARHGVRVNAVAPSFVETPMAARIFSGIEGEREFYEGTVPLGRFAQPSEIAKVVLHLVGDDASFTTGMVYRVDGGSTAGYFEPPR